MKSTVGYAFMKSLPVMFGYIFLWRRNTLLSIAGGTICYMLLVQNVFHI